MIRKLISTIIIFVFTIQSTGAYALSRANSALRTPASIKTDVSGQIKGAMHEANTPGDSSMSSSAVSPLVLQVRNRPLDLQAVFGNSNPVIVEVGFGYGWLLAEESRKHPEQNFIGIELYAPSNQKVRNLRLGANVQFIEGDGRYILDKNFEDNSLNEVRVIFPDPGNMREPDDPYFNVCLLLRPPFVQTVCNKLKPGGRLVIVTENEDINIKIFNEVRKIEEFGNRIFDKVLCADDPKSKLGFSLKQSGWYKMRKENPDGYNYIILLTKTSHGSSADKPTVSKGSSAFQNDTSPKTHDAAAADKDKIKGAMHEKAGRDEWEPVEKSHPDVTKLAGWVRSVEPKDLKTLKKGTIIYIRDTGSWVKYIIQVEGDGIITVWLAGNQWGYRGKAELLSSVTYTGVTGKGMIMPNGFTSFPRFQYADRRLLKVDDPRRSADNKLPWSQAFRFYEILYPDSSKNSDTASNIKGAMHESSGRLNKYIQIGTVAFALIFSEAIVFKQIINGIFKPDNRIEFVEKSKQGILGQGNLRSTPKIENIRDQKVPLTPKNRRTPGAETITAARDMNEAVIEFLNKDKNSEYKRNVLFLTIMIQMSETEYRTRKQYSGGPGRGFSQFEAARTPEEQKRKGAKFTAQDLWQYICVNSPRRHVYQPMMVKIVGGDWSSIAALNGYELGQKLSEEKLDTLNAALTVINIERKARGKHLDIPDRNNPAAVRDFYLKAWAPGKPISLEKFKELSKQIPVGLIDEAFSGEVPTVKNEIAGAMHEIVDKERFADLVEASNWSLVIKCLKELVSLPNTKEVFAGYLSGLDDLRINRLISRIHSEPTLAYFIIEAQRYKKLEAAKRRAEAENFVRELSVMFSPERRAKLQEMKNKIQDGEKVRILFVCSINNQRSFLMEMISKDIIEKSGLGNVSVSSCGYDFGAFAYQPLAEICVEKGIDRKIVRSFKGRKIDSGILENADYVITADSNAGNGIRKDFPAHSAKIMLVGDVLPGLVNKLQAYSSARMSAHEMPDFALLENDNRISAGEYFDIVYNALKADLFGIKETAQIKIAMHEATSNQVMDIERNNAMKLPKDDARTLKASLVICLAVAAFNTQTRERVLAHFLPTGHFDSEKYIEGEVYNKAAAKKEYIENLLKDIKGPEWRVTVVSSGKELEKTRPDALDIISINDLTGYLRNRNGVDIRNIQTEEADAPKIVFINNKGEINIKYDVLFTPPVVARSFVGVQFADKAIPSSLVLGYSPKVSENKTRLKLVLAIARRLSTSDKNAFVVLSYENDEQRRNIYEALETIKDEKIMKHLYVAAMPKAKEFMLMMNKGGYAVKYSRMISEATINEQGIENNILVDVAPGAVTNEFEKQFEQEIEVLIKA